MRSPRSSERAELQPNPGISLAKAAKVGKNPTKIVRKNFYLSHLNLATSRLSGSNSGSDWSRLGARVICGRVKGSLSRLFRSSICHYRRMKKLRRNPKLSMARKYLQSAALAVASRLWRSCARSRRCSTGITGCSGLDTFLLRWDSGWTRSRAAGSFTN